MLEERAQLYGGSCFGTWPTLDQNDYNAWDRTLGSKSYCVARAGTVGSHTLSNSWLRLAIAADVGTKAGGANLGAAGCVTVSGAALKPALLGWAVDCAFTRNGQSLFQTGNLGIKIDGKSYWVSFSHKTASPPASSLTQGKM